MNELSQWIREQITAQGPVPFVTFMEWALYHPEWGYYTSDRHKIGKAGDFYTTPHVNPVFAEVLADEIAGKLQKLAVSSYTLIEVGAGVGKLALDLLNRLRDEHEGVYSQLTYRIVEKSPTLRAEQQAALHEHGDKVVWQTFEELQAGAPYQGVVLTNELVDAFPVHRVTRLEGDDLLEVYVTWDEAEGKFTETTGPLSDERIGAYLEAYGKKLRLGQTSEVGLAGLDWYDSALRLLDLGHVITIDYGFDAEMLYHPSRRNGTLRGFYRHTLTDDPYQHIGEQDLTADVNFTALIKRGEELGWQTEFYNKQSKFLFQGNILQRLTSTVGADPFASPDMKRNMAIKQLLLPGGIGDHFTVLIQSTGVMV